MAQFLKVWKQREEILNLIVKTASEAESACVKEFKAAVLIQSWFRGCRVRAYLAHLHACAVTIQRHFRGHLGRREYRKRLEQCLDEMQVNYYNSKAIMIQRNWRGYYVRRFVFDYRAYKDYLRGVVVVNELTRARIQQEVEQRERERQEREETLIELEAQRQARRHHYLLGTAIKEGVFKKDSRRQSHPFEDRMRAIQFSTPVSSRRASTKRSKSPPPLSTITCSTLLTTSTKPRPSPDGRAASEGRENEPRVSLPPLVKVQGPFRAPEEVQRLKSKPLNPTLRVATSYDHVELRRAQLKSEDWSKCVIEERFRPFYKRRETSKYEPLLHTCSSYQGALATYGLGSELRPQDPHKHISNKPFRTILKPIATFDELSSTY